MRRSPALIFATVALGLGGLGITACSSVAKSPTVAHTDFTPKVELEAVVRCANGIGCTGTDLANPRVVLSGPHSPGSAQIVSSVPDHAVLVITSQAPGTQRVTGSVKEDQVFDTGQMVRGDTTTVVLSTPGRVTITDTTTGEHVTLTVRPAPTAKV